jgi:hypothetical protein
MKVLTAAACTAAFFLVVLAQALGAPVGVAHASPHHMAAARPMPGPWVEGVTPPLENQLFETTYKTLPHHNVLKVYVFDASGYESAGIRFSARVPHEPEDLSETELTHEAAELIRTTFDEYPDIQELDVWATIPVTKAEATEVESTVFSVSADRTTYERIRGDTALDDTAFLLAFGQVWVAPQVPR